MPARRRRSVSGASTPRFYRTAARGFEKRTAELGRVARPAPPCVMPRAGGSGLFLLRGVGGLGIALAGLDGRGLALFAGLCAATSFAAAGAFLLRVTSSAAGTFLLHVTGGTAGAFLLGVGASATGALLLRILRGLHVGGRLGV